MRIKERTEAQEQEALIEWCELNKGRYPELAKILHIPNGGYRTPAEAAHFKRLGVKAGVPDLLLPYPVGDHHGLWIEMKSETGRASSLQKEWIEKLRAFGYAAYVCVGFKAGQDCLVSYLDGKIQAQTTYCQKTDLIWRGGNI